MTGTGESNGPEYLAPAIGGVTVSRDGDRVTLQLSGDHDLSTVGLLSTALVEVVAADDVDVVIDLGDVAFMDGSTIGALVQARTLLTGRDRCLAVRSPSRIQRWLLQVCDLADLIEPSLIGEEAQRAIDATPLETWVQVPATPRAAKGAPPTETEVDATQDDAERSRH